jgi:hypothetical protein
MMEGGLSQVKRELIAIRMYHYLHKFGKGGGGEVVSEVFPIITVQRLKCTRAGRIFPRKQPTICEGNNHHSALTFPTGRPVPEASAPNENDVAWIDNDGDAEIREFQ